MYYMCKWFDFSLPPYFKKVKCLSLRVLTAVRPSSRRGKNEKYYLTLFLLILDYLLDEERHLHIMFIIYFSKLYGQLKEMGLVSLIVKLSPLIISRFSYPIFSYLLHVWLFLTNLYLRCTEFKPWWAILDFSLLMFLRSIKCSP